MMNVKICQSDALHESNSNISNAQACPRGESRDLLPGDSLKGEGNLMNIRKSPGLVGVAFEMG